MLFITFTQITMHHTASGYQLARFLALVDNPYGGYTRYEWLSVAMIDIVNNHLSPK